MEFDSFVGQNFSLICLSQDNIMAEAFFRVFDEDNSNALNFLEYMMVKNAPNLENPEEKLKWIFNAFDQDGGGSIDVDELYGIVEALFKMTGKEMDDEEVSEEIDTCVDEIIETVDTDGDEVITEDEFVKNAMKSQFILNMFNCTDN